MKLKGKLASIVLVALAGAAIAGNCPQCGDVSEEWDSPTFKREYSPPMHKCASPNTADFECLTSPGYTDITNETDYDFQEPGQPPIITGPYEVPYLRCFTDDTGCQRL